MASLFSIENTGVRVFIGAQVSDSSDPAATYSNSFVGSMDDVVALSIALPDTTIRNLANDCLSFSSCDPLQTWPINS
jgi:hypothetical protein